MTKRKRENRDNKIKISNKKTRRKAGIWRFVLTVFMLIFFVVAVNGCKGCKNEREIPSENGKPEKQTKNGMSVDISNYEFVIPATSKRQMKIVTSDGELEGETGPFTLTGITATLMEDGKDIAVITAENCVANIVGEKGTAEISGNVIIRAFDEKNNVVVKTDKLSWNSDSDKITLGEFSIQLNDKNTLTAKSGVASYDLKTIKYKSQKLEMKD